MKRVVLPPKTLPDGVSVYSRWFEYENERFKVLRAKKTTASGKPGTHLDENLTIACKSDSIQILEIQRQGKNKQTTKDFLLGKKISKGSILV